MFTRRKFNAMVAVPLMSAALPLSMQTAAAQTTPENAELTQGPSLEEVTVTARRREENLMKVPLSVAVTTAADVENAGVKDIKQLARFTPGLFAQNQDSSGVGDRRLNQLTFRGLSTSQGAQFIDGSPFGGRGAPLDVTDVERVEVLKGPQSVYFGRATFVGAVNYVTKAPGDEFAGRVSADIYSYGGADGRVMVEGPLLADGLLNARLSVRNYKFGGQYHNSFDQTVRMGEESTKSATLSLSSKPSDKLSLSGYYSYSLEDDGPGNNGKIRATPVGTGPTLTCNQGGTGGPFWCGELPKFSDLDPNTLGNYSTLDPWTRNALFGGKQASPTPFAVDWKDGFGFKREIHHVHARGDLSFDSGWEASSLLAYSATRLQQVTPRDGLDTFGMTNPFYVNNPACVAGLPSCVVPPRPQLSTNLFNVYYDYSAEVRVSSPQSDRLRGTIGVSYYKADGPPSASFGTVNSGQLVNTGTGGVKDWVDTPAVFGGLYFDVTDNLKLSAEGRYQWDKIGRQQVWQTVGPKLEETFTSFSPRLSVDYTLPDDSLVYASFSRGYRPGGFNVTLLPLTPYALSQLSGYVSGITYDQEVLDNYEIGHKGTWFDNRLRTTLAVYQMNWSDGQVLNNVFVELTPGGNISNVMITSNVGKVRLRGFELEADFAATRNLTVSGTFAYAQNKLLNYINTPQGARVNNQIDVSGNTLGQTPKITASLSPTYTREINADWEWFTRLDYFYNSKIYTSPDNLAWRGARSLVNARLGFNKASDFKAELYVNNLFDDDTLTEASVNSDAVFAPNTTCPPCYNPALPPQITPAVGVLNVIGFAPPVKRTVGVRFTKDF